MSEAETLRMAAEVVDNFSGPVKNMQRSLRELANQMKAGGEAGISATNDQSKSFRDLHRDVGKLRQEFSGAFTPALAAVGITALSTGGAIAGMVAALKSLGYQSQSLAYLSRQTALSTDSLRLYEKMAERVGSSSDEMDASLRTFGNTMAAAGRDYLVPLQPLLNIHGAFEAVFGSVQRLKSLTREGQLNSVFEFLRKNYSVDQKRAVLGALSLPENFANASIDELRRSRSEIEQWVKAHPLDLGKGLKAKAAFDELRESIDGVKNDLSIEFSSPLIATIKELSDGAITASKGLREVFKIIRALRDWNLTIDFTPPKGSNFEKLGKYLSDPDRGSRLIDKANRDVRGAMTSDYGPGPGGKPEALSMEGFFKRYGENAKEGTKPASAAQGLWQRLFPETPASQQQNGATLAPQKMSYQPTSDLRALLQKASYTPGASATAAPGMAGSSGRREFETAVTIGTRKGVFDGLLDWVSYMRGGAVSGGVAAIKAAFNPGGGVQSPGVPGMQEPMAPAGAEPPFGGRRGDRSPGEQGPTVPGGTTRGDRNNNPGNMEFGAFAKAHGATGSDGRFAIFPTREAGTAAMGELLKQHYGGMTLGAMARKWVGPGIPDSYIKGLEKSTGIGRDQVPDLNDKTMLGKIEQGIMRGEGTAGNSAPSQNARAGHDLASIGAMMKELARSSFNLMHGQYGRPGENLTTIATPGGKKVTVNRAAAPSFKGFLSELEKQGAPIHELGGYANRNIAGTGHISQHAYGNAIDVDQSSRNVVTRDFAKWALEHKEALLKLQQKWGISSGGNMSSPDFGHFEWNGQPPWLDKETKEAAAKHGDELRKHFGVGHRGGAVTDGDHRASPFPIQRADLLGTARRAGMMGPAQQTMMASNARLQVDFNGLPRGSKTKLDHVGFKEVQLNRGRPMATASEDA